MLILIHHNYHSWKLLIYVINTFSAYVVVFLQDLQKVKRIKKMNE